MAIFNFFENKLIKIYFFNFSNKILKILNIKLKFEILVDFVSVSLIKET